MPLAFSAVQNLDLPVQRSSERLAEYLTDERRVVGSLLSPEQLTELEPGRYRYAVTPLQLFQLRIEPLVELRVDREPGRLELRSTACELQGVPGIEDDFDLRLGSWLEVAGPGLRGCAELKVSVSQPAVLRLIPSRVLEATGESLLNGILLSIKGRVGQQLVRDFHQWCDDPWCDLPPATTT
jgi:Protein of unknown function (DUF1997)